MLTWRLRRRQLCLFGIKLTAPYQETKPELVALARRLARRSPKTGKARSLRQIAAELAMAGYTTANGVAFSAAQVKRFLGR